MSETAPEAAAGQVQTESAEAATTPAPPAPAAQEEAAKQEQANLDARKIDQLPKWAQEELQRARQQVIKLRNGESRDLLSPDQVAAKQEEAAAAAREEAAKDVARQIGIALGLVEDESAKPVDPQILVQQLTEKAAEADKRAADNADRLRRTLVELAVHRSSGKVGADPDALLDSRSFVLNIHGLDPDTDGFAARLDEVIKLAVEDNPKFKASGLSGPPTKSGGEFSAGPGPGSDAEDKSVDDFRRERRKKSSS
ncbi:hypothetical protein ACIBKY_50965 [Nonomuraea sp. NPDC050394]|uniref:hypothetical protein n=1 Tax=Nonomuraea sp. NPDC050394 TaxID=3364363 RepID=UPI00378ED203